MIPAECKDDIIQSGMTFMRAITEAYGTDAGMKLWDTIATTLDPDVKGQIFFAMLTGEYNSIITINGYQPGSNNIGMIKTIRMVDKRKLGLKEAKDLADTLSSGKTIKLEVDPKVRGSMLTELRKAGFYV